MKRVICYSSDIHVACILLLMLMLSSTTAYGQPGVHGSGLFVHNRGQWSDDSIRFTLEDQGCRVVVRDQMLSLRFDAEMEDESSQRLCVNEISIDFPGSNQVTPVGHSIAASTFNYFVGSDPARHQSNVESYSSVIYPNLYDGIDLIVMPSDNKHLIKYHFIVSPGSDSEEILVRYHGIDSLRLNETGDLLITGSMGVVRDSAPVVWQEESGRRTEVTGCAFHLIDPVTCGFSISTSYDESQPLIIDPDVEWMSYYGGSSRDYAMGMQPDGFGNMILIGYTYSDDFHGHENAFHGGDNDVYAAKITSEGDLVWMTYLGGTKADRASDLAIDSTGNIYITGATESWDFEGQTNDFHIGLNDGFVVKIDSEGQLQWMTYVGGTGYEYGFGIAVNDLGESYLVGSTWSFLFEGRVNHYLGGSYDGYLVKVNEVGDVQWMYYLGGSDTDVAKDISIDSTGTLIVSGTTQSDDCEGRTNDHHGGISDAFMAGYSPEGLVNWMTYMGGSSWDEGESIILDGSDIILMTGWSMSDDFEGRTNSYMGAQDAFVLRASPTGLLDWMTYLGGSGYDSSRGITLLPSGLIATAGWTDSLDYAGRTNTIHDTNTSDGVLTLVDEYGVLQWSTYLGGPREDVAYSVAPSRSGDHFLVSGYTSSYNIEKRTNHYFGGKHDACVFDVPISLPTDRWTIVIHGYANESYDKMTDPDSDQGWMYDTAEAIGNLDETPIEIHTMDRNTFEILTGDPFNAEAHHVLLFDWALTSNINYKTGIGHQGFAYAGGDALYSFLEMWDLTDRIEALIGYDRGAVVASEVVRRMVLNQHQPKQVIYLDGEGGDLDGSAGYLDSSFDAWDNVDTADPPIRYDNVYSTYDENYLDRYNFGGHPLDRAYNTDVGPDWPHYAMRRYLIDHLCYNGERFHISAPTTAPSQAAVVPDAVESLYNGDVGWSSMAGWLSHGASGQGLIKEEVGFVRLTHTAPERVHSYSYVSPEMTQLHVRARHLGQDSGMIQITWNGEVFAQAPLARFGPLSLKRITVDLPDGAPGTVGLLGFHLIGVDPETAIDLDDISFVP